ncbi:MAG: type III-A CRISPR-associated protein Csm2 [Candidatus Aenigmarchaeota archaeon ex4484_52]|nr:MAG: type III-A CRISPR-associated protein Csm2 [Candidatus Aenigmarchaeota archaeon ex4484_52]
MKKSWKNKIKQKQHHNTTHFERGNKENNRGENMNYNQQHNRNREYELLKILKEKKLEDIELKNIAGDKGDIEQFAKKIDGIETNQIRNFFDKIKKLEKDKDFENKLILLVPNIKYAKARKLVPNEFVELIILLVEGLQKSTDKKNALKKMVTIMTVFVAYHKYYYSKKQR